MWMKSQLRHFKWWLCFFSFSSVLGDKREFYLTFVNEGVTASVDVTLLFYAISCKHFNESSGLWNETGCRLVNATSAWTTCRCSHLTTFGASSIPVQATMTFVPLSVGITESSPIDYVREYCRRVSLMLFLFNLICIIKGHKFDLYVHLYIVISYKVLLKSDL